MRRTPDPSSGRRWARLCRFPKSVVCIIVTSGGRPESAPTSRHARGASCRQVARDPTSLDRCVDLSAFQRTPAGDRARRPRPQTVPLPSALARGPRRSQIQQAPDLHPRTAEIASSGRGRPQPSWPAARTSSSCHRPTNGYDALSDREQRVRQGEQELWFDDAARPAC